jgi:hypothetical protein
MLSFFTIIFKSDNLQMTWPYDITCPILESVQFLRRNLRWICDFSLIIELGMHRLPI